MTFVSIGIGNYQLRDDAAASFQRMRAAGAPDTKINSAYRSYEQQSVLFKANYTSSYAASSKKDKRIWNGTPYWRRSPYSNYVGVAVPGSPQSNHEGGTALDVDSTPVSPLWAWMNSYAAPYGWRKTIATEPWHWEYNSINDTKKDDDDMPTTTEIWNYPVHRGAANIPVIQEVADSKTLLLALQEQLKNIQIPVPPAPVIDYTKLANAVANELDARELARLNAVKDA